MWQVDKDSTESLDLNEFSQFLHELNSEQPATSPRRVTSKQKRELAEQAQLDAAGVDAKVLTRTACLS